MSQELWVPEDREVWGEAVTPTLAALAAWCVDGFPQPLTFAEGVRVNR
jgi:hypothetical protein